MQTDGAAIWVKMLTSRYPADLAPDINSPGVYALFLRSGVLGKISPAEDGLLYIGMTDSSLEARKHFRHKSSGFSTLRRSLGSILRAELDLVPIPRSPGSSKANFMFAADGEGRLTQWMLANLSYAFAAFSGDRRALERQLIRDRQPPLNLTGWKNPQAGNIKALRALCRQLS